MPSWRLDASGPCYSADEDWRVIRWTGKQKWNGSTNASQLGGRLGSLPAPSRHVLRLKKRSYLERSQLPPCSAGPSA